jgi:hypothetical protein
MHTSSLSPRESPLFTLISRSLAIERADGQAYIFVDADAASNSPQAGSPTSHQQGGCSSSG